MSSVEEEIDITMLDDIHQQMYGEKEFAHSPLPIPHTHTCTPCPSTSATSASHSFHAFILLLRTFFTQSSPGTYTSTYTLSPSTHHNLTLLLRNPHDADIPELISLTMHVLRQMETTKVEVENGVIIWGSETIHSFLSWLSNVLSIISLYEWDGFVYFLCMISIAITSLGIGFTMGKKSSHANVTEAMKSRIDNLVTLDEDDHSLSTSTSTPITSSLQIKRGLLLTSWYFFIFVVFIYFLGFMHEFYNMYRHLYVQSLNVRQTGIPEYCLNQSNQRSVWYYMIDSILHSKRKNECETYLYTLHRSSIPNVFEVLITYSSRTLLSPIHHIGDVLGKFIASFLSHQSYLMSFSMMIFMPLISVGIVMGLYFIFPFLLLCVRWRNRMMKSIKGNEQEEKKKLKQSEKEKQKQLQNKKAPPSSNEFKRITSGPSSSTPNREAKQAPSPSSDSDRTTSRLDVSGISSSNVCTCASCPTRDREDASNVQKKREENVQDERKESEYDPPTSSPIKHSKHENVSS